MSIPGFGTISAMMIMTEIIDISRFKKVDNFRSYFGVAPGEDSTGEEETITGLTQIRNKVLRTVIIEPAWVAVRKDPALMMAFAKLSKRMKKNEAIIRIAKKMINRLWYVLKNKNPYQIGVVE